MSPYMIHDPISMSHDPMRNISPMRDPTHSVQCIVLQNPMQCLTTRDLNYVTVLKPISSPLNPMINPNYDPTD